MLSPNLDTRDESPLYYQLYNYIKEEIKTGNLKAKDKLPSKRNLSSHLDISINTVGNAYNLLIDEGYIYSLERVGYFVSNIDNLATIKTEIRPREKLDMLENTIKYNFKFNTTDTENFPLYNFRKISKDILSRNDWLIEKDPQGISDLRKCIKDYLRESRALYTSEDNIIISSGIEYLFQILFYILPKGSIYAFENPGYRIFKDLFENNGISYCPINLDSRGLSYKLLKESPANILCITPSHQFPTGLIMPINRRLELLEWANRKGYYLIEDDYDSEFKYYGKPIPSLKSLDKMDNVIYISNFSKSISSSLRLSYMVLPDSLLKTYLKVMPFVNCPVSTLNQMIIAEFISRGYFERHLNRMRNIYKRKRSRVVKHLALYENLKVYDSKAGLHLILEIRKNISEEELLKRAYAKGVLVSCLSHYYIDKAAYKYPKILLGFAAIEEDQLEEALDYLMDIWQINKTI